MHNPGLLATWLTTIIESNPIGETAFSDFSQDIKLGNFIHHPVRTVLHIYSRLRISKAFLKSMNLLFQDVLNNFCVDQINLSGLHKSYSFENQFFYATSG
jgi:hypothetical protein